MKAIHLKLGIAGLCIAAGAAYWYYSPLIALHQMRTAAQERNAAVFNDHVDYPRLRASVKTQLTASFNEKIGHSDTGVAGAAGAVLGKVLGTAMFDQIVDAMVRPEVVMDAMQHGSGKPPPAGTAEETADKPKPVYTSERIGFDKYILHVEPSKPTDRRLSLVMERYGFASWKLVDVGSASR